MFSRTRPALKRPAESDAAPGPSKSRKGCSDRLGGSTPRTHTHTPSTPYSLRPRAALPSPSSGPSSLSSVPGRSELAEASANSPSQIDSGLRTTRAAAKARAAAPPFNASRPRAPTSTPVSFARTSKPPPLLSSTELMDVHSSAPPEPDLGALPTSLASTAATVPPHLEIPAHADDFPPSAAPTDAAAVFQHRMPFSENDEPHKSTHDRGNSNHVVHDPLAAAESTLVGGGTKAFVNAEETTLTAGDDDENEDVDEDEDEDDDEVEDEEDEDIDGFYAGDYEGNDIGFNLRAMAGFFSNHHGRFKVLLEKIKPRCPPSEQLPALEELANLLSMSQEETLVGQFDTDAFVREFVRVMGGTPPKRDLRTQTRWFRAGDLPEDPNPAEAFADEPPLDDGTLCERQILACRCLANLIEAMPFSTRSVVENNGVPAMVAKLVDMQVVDLAEQCLETLEKISATHPNGIVREGGLMAMLSYLDFFNIHAQRTAMNTVSNCCRRLQEEDFPLVRGSVPLISRMVLHPDHKLQEAACKSVVRIIESFRQCPTLLQQLVSPELCSSLKTVLAPPTMDSTEEESKYGTTISATMITELVRAVGLAVRASPSMAEHLMTSDFTQVLYVILSGSQPPRDLRHIEIDIRTFPATREEPVGLNKMALLHNFSSRPKEQLQEALNLTIELLPPLEQAGVFDASNYTQEALTWTERMRSVSSLESSEEQKQKQLEMIQAAEKLAASKSVSAAGKVTPETYSLVLKLCKLMLPVLVEIHTASAIPSVRNKAIFAILKVLAFPGPEELKWILKSVSMSAFLAGVLSSDDGPMSVQDSLQIVELLLAKLGPGYRRLLERAGVMWEIEQLVEQNVTQECARTGEHGGVVLPFPTDLSLSAPGLGESKLIGTQLTSIRQKNANILRARMIALLYAKPESEQGHASVLDHAISLANNLRSSALESEAEAKADLAQVFLMLASDTTGLSGWELLKSGLTEALLAFVGDSSTSTPASDSQHAKAHLPTQERRNLFTQALAAHHECGQRLIQRLQETVSRVQNFEVVSLGSAADDITRRYPGLGLTKQMRLKVSAAEPGLSSLNCPSFVVGIQAAASFAALEEYLRARLVSHPVQYSRSPPMQLSSILSTGPSGASPHQNVPSGGRPATGTTRDTLSDVKILHDQGLDTYGASRAEGNDHLGAIHFPKRGEPSVRSEEAVEASPKEQYPASPSTPGSDSFESESGIRTPICQECSGSPSREPYQDHFLFTVGGCNVSPEDTVFSAVYNMLKSRNPDYVPDRSIWNLSYPVSFRHVRGPRPHIEEALRHGQDQNSRFLSDPIIANALKLLQVLFDAYNDIHVTSSWGGKEDEVATLFVNNKLTAQLNRQLEEPLVTASQVLPEWVQHLPRLFPFLFPFDTRFSFLEATAFGATRTISRWQTQMRTSGDNSAVNWAREESFGYLGRLSRKKVRIGRDNLMGSIVHICDSFVSRNSVLETEYFDEVGTGLGPTLEFYSLASREFASCEHDLWLGSHLAVDGPGCKALGKSKPKAKAKFQTKAKAKDPTTHAGHGHGKPKEEDASQYVQAPQGLFPIPIRMHFDTAYARSNREKKRIHLFRSMGTFVAKSLLDSRIIHIDFSPVFLALVIDFHVPYTLDSLGRIDRGLASSLEKLYGLSEEEVASLSLDFTLPGDDTYELVREGKHKAVTKSNLPEYLDSILEAYVGQGVTPLIEAFRQGFAKVIDPQSLALFTPDELTKILGDAPEDWSRSTLSTAIKPDHGFTAESPAFQNLLSLLSSFDRIERRVFLQWLTGSPKLPIGGFGALQPPLTVVRRPHESPLCPDDYLPSVMTCVNYLKLPSYSSGDILQMRIRKAMHEGGHSFHLS